MKDLSQTVAALKDPQLATFSRTFLEAWTDHGFGAFSKRDTELLIFTALREAFGDDAPRSNWEWAALLRMTPARARNLRRDAYMRFADRLAPEQVAELLIDCLGSVHSLDVDFDQGLGGDVRIVADNPIVEIELEPRLKSLGGYFNYERNREILRIPLRDYLALADDLLGAKGKQTFVALLEKIAEDQARHGAVADELASLKWAGKSEGEKLKDFLVFLAKQVPGGASKLIGYATRIFKAQKFY